MSQDWTGRLAFDVLTPKAHLKMGAVEFVVRMEDVTIFYAERCLAVIQREDLRSWLHNSVSAWTVDDITFSAHGRQLLLALDQAPPLTVPAKVTAQLKALT